MYIQDPGCDYCIDKGLECFRRADASYRVCTMCQKQKKTCSIKGIKRESEATIVKKEKRLRVQPPKPADASTSAEPLAAASAAKSTTR
jgi:hypothetical protein